MYGIITTVGAAVVCLSFPLMLLADKRLSCRTRNVIRAAMSVSGLVLTALIATVLYAKTAKISDGVAGWARDFFFGYAKLSVVSSLIFTLILWLGERLNASSHVVRRLTAIAFPIILTASGILFADAASGGFFEVGVYIRAVATSSALITHASFIIPEKKA